MLPAALALAAAPPAPPTGILGLLLPVILPEVAAARAEDARRDSRADAVDPPRRGFAPAAARRVAADVILDDAGRVPEVDRVVPLRVVVEEELADEAGREAVAEDGFLEAG